MYKAVPSYSMGAKTNEPKAKLILPGPGCYESQDKSPIHNKAADYSFGTENRGKSIENRHTPRTGPGSYDPYRESALDSL